MLIIAVALAVFTARSGGVREAKQAVQARRAGVRIERTRFHSKRLHRTLDEVVVLPRDFDVSQHRPLLAYMHGRKGHVSSPYNGRITKALGSIHSRNAPIVLFVNGGSHSYYHDRRDGAWGSYITTELVPSVARKYGVDTKRIAYGGVSMGGYGALELTRETGVKRCGVAGIAPALWLQPGDSAPGAYDDADDFNAHDALGDIRAHPRTALHGTPVWLAGGNSDPFKPGTDAAAAALRNAHMSVIRRNGAGGHDGGYFNRQYLPMLRWFTQRFARCQ